MAWASVATSLLECLRTLSGEMMSRSSGTSVVACVVVLVLVAVMVCSIG